MTAKRIALLSVKEEGGVLKRHSKSGGVVAYKDKKNCLHLEENGQSVGSIDLGQIPVSHKGKHVSLGLNCLAAMIAFYELGLTFQEIISGLSRFSSDLHTNPGRNNLLSSLPFKAFIAH